MFTIDLDVKPAICKSFHNKEAMHASKYAWKQLFGKLRYLRKNFKHNTYALFVTYWENGEPIEARQFNV